MRGLAIRVLIRAMYASAFSGVRPMSGPVQIFCVETRGRRMTRAFEGASLAKEAAFLACVSALPTMFLPRVRYSKFIRIRSMSALAAVRLVEHL